MAGGGRGVSSVLWFLLTSAGIVAFGWVVSRVSGARSHLLPEWAYAPGERVVWRDGRADVLIAPRWGGVDAALAAGAVGGGGDERGAGGNGRGGLRCAPRNDGGGKKADCAALHPTYAC